MPFLSSYAINLAAIFNILSQLSMVVYIGGLILLSILIILINKHPLTNDNAKIWILLKIKGCYST